MTLDPNQQAELEHLTRCSLTHPNWALYCRLKAEWRAEKEPKYWGWLPAALAKAIATAITGST